MTNIINNSGIEFLTVHGRTVRDRFNDSTLNLGAIKKMKSLLRIPVVGNGNIFNPKMAREFLEFTNVDVLMIGRAAMGNPEIFNHIDKYLKEGVEHITENNIKKMKENIKLYEHCINEYLSDNFVIPYSFEKYKFMELKRNLIWLSKNIQGSTNLRIKISKTKNLDELDQIINGLN